MESENRAAVATRGHIQAIRVKAASYCDRVLPLCARWHCHCRATVVALTVGLGAAIAAVRVVLELQAAGERHI